MFRRIGKFLAGLAVCGLLGISSVEGAGFAIIEQTTRSMGRALGGVTADTNDPNALYFNASIPAWFDHDQISLGIHFLKIHINYSDKGSTPSLGDEEGNGIGGWSNIPNLVYVHPITETLSFGFSISGTSGTKTDYKNEWIGRYTATLTDIAVMDFNPVIAWRPVDNFAIGLGLVFEYAMVKQEQMLDFRSANDAAQQLSAYGPYWDGPSSVRDGKIKMDGDSVAMGFTAGMSYKPWQGTTLGLGFRSRMRHHLKDMKVRSHSTSDMKSFLAAHYPGTTTTMSQILGFDSFNTRGKASSYLHLPASVTFGVMQDITEKWRVGLDIAWSEQHVMEDLRADFNHTMYGQVDSQRLVMHWGDNWRVALGTEYDLTDKLTVRTGVAWDQTPIQEKYRNTKMPDADRYWFTLGLGYQFTEKLRADFAWTHICYESPSIHQAVNEDETINGKYGARSETFSLSMTYSF